MCFYYKFAALCKARNKSETRVLIEAGLSKTLLSKWRSKPETVPNGETIIALCDYFDISADELLCREKAPAKDEGLTEDEAELLRLFRELNAEGQSAALAALGGIASTSIYKKCSADNMVSGA